MPKLRVQSFTMSLDGYGAGPNQDLDNPLGVGGVALHEWAFATRTFRQMFGSEGGTSGIDDDFAARGFDNIGAWIMGRNMFGPIRGPWPDGAWKGWWGDNPPYHCPVFVLTRHPRAPITMDGGTTFHFVTDGIHAALERAAEAAEGRDIRLGGGVATIQQYLRAGLVDEMHLAISPILLGSGEHLFAGSTRQSSAIGAPSTFPQRTPRTLSSRRAVAPNEERTERRLLCIVVEELGRAPSMIVNDSPCAPAGMPSSKRRRFWDSSLRVWRICPKCCSDTD
jgi:dihydrofolate reductase